MSLTDFLLDFDNTSFFEADYFKVTLPNGFVITATSHQNDLVLGSPAITYYATKYGKWARDAVMFERNTPNETTLTMACDPAILFPYSVSTPMFQRTKLFARAKVEIGVVYMDLNEIVKGTQVVFAGLITSPSVESSLATFKCADYMYLLQAAWPKRVICSGCPFAVFDVNCNLDRSAFAVTRTVLAGSTQTSLVVSALGSVGTDSLPYAKGYIVPTSGEAQGWNIGVPTQPDSTHLSLAPFDLPIAVGDTFTLYPGCNGTQDACTNKFNNVVNFGGFPYVPGPQSSVTGR